MKLLSIFMLCGLAAQAGQAGGSRTSAPTQLSDSNARIAVLETKVESLGSETQKLQQKIDSLITQVQDLNTKMNLVLLVGSILFGATITQIAGAFGRKA